MTFGPPVVSSPFNGQSFSTNRASVDLIVKLTEDTKELRVNGLDVTSSLISVSGTDFEVPDDKIIPTSEVSYWKLQVSLSPNKTNQIQLISVSKALVEESVTISITSIPASSVGVTVENPIDLKTDSKNEAVELSWIDNNDILGVPEGSGYNIYVSTSLDKRPGTYVKVNTLPLSDTSTSDQIKSVLSETSVEGTQSADYTEPTNGSVKTEFAVSEGLTTKRYFIIERTILGDETADFDTLKSTLKTEAQTKLSTIGSFLVFTNSLGSSYDITSKTSSEQYLTALDGLLTDTGTPPIDPDKSEYIHDAGLIVNKYPDLFPLYTYKKTDLDVTDLNDTNIQDSINVANIIIALYPDLVSGYTYGVIKSVENDHSLWAVLQDSVGTGGSFEGTFYKNTKTYVAEVDIGLYFDFIKSELVFVEYPLYQYKYVVNQTVNTITKVEKSVPELQLKYTLTEVNMPEGMSFLIGEPIFFRVAFEYRNDVSQVIVESTLSPETVGIPITLSNSTVTLKHPTPVEIQNVLISSINNSVPELDLKPGSVARSVFVNPISTAHQTLHFKEYFREVSQSFQALLEFDGTDSSGNSLPVNKSSNKKTLRSAYGLTDTEENNLLVQDFVDNKFDLLASNYGLTRNISSSAEGQVLVKATTLVGTSNTIQLGSGSAVATASPSVEFVVLSTLTRDNFSAFKDADGFFTTTVNIRAVESGIAGNVPANSITVVKGGSNPSLSVTNLSSTFGGKDKATNSELAERVKALQSGVDTGTPKGLIRAIADSGLARKVKIIPSGDPFMKRGFDYVKNKLLAGYVDIYIKGKFPRNHTEVFGVFYEKQKGISVNFTTNSLGDNPYGFGTPYAEIDFLVDNPGFDKSYLDIYDILRAEISNPPGNTFVTPTNIDLTSHIKTKDFRIAVDLEKSDVTFSGSVTTSVSSGKIKYDLGNVTDYSDYKNKAISVSGFVTSDNNVNPLENLKGRPLYISDAGVGYLEVLVAGATKSKESENENLGDQIVSIQTSFQTEFPNVSDSSGNITNDVAEITVLLNATPVVPNILTGSTGTFVLPTAPNIGDTLTIDYTHNSGNAEVVAEDLAGQICGSKTSFQTEFPNVSDSSGNITNDVAEITVLLNATPVVPSTLDGATGIFVLASAPEAGDTLSITYTYRDIKEVVGEDLVDQIFSIQTSFQTEFLNVLDPSGVVTDDVAEITVLLNATPVVPSTLDGATGIFVLASAPEAGDTLSITYTYSLEESGTVATVTIGHTNITTASKILSQALSTTRTAGTLRFETADSVDYTQYIGEAISSSGFSFSENDIGELTTISPVSIVSSGVGFVEITDPGSGAVETSTATIKMSGNLDLYLFSTASPISFDLLMRKEFFHRVSKKPLDTLTALVDSNNVTYKSGLNYNPFNNSRTLLEGGSLIEDSGIKIESSPIEKLITESVAETSLVNDKLHLLTDCWLTSLPIMETVSGVSKTYLYKRDFTVQKNDKFFYIRLNTDFVLDTGQTSIRLKVKYGKNHELSREISLTPGLDVYVDLVKYWYFPVIITTTGTPTQNTTDKVLTESIDYDLLASDKNSVYIKLKDFVAPVGDTLTITYYNNTTVGAPTNFNDPVLTGDDFRLSLATGLPKSLSHFGIEPTSIIVRPYNDLNILLEPFVLNQDYKLVLVPDTEVKIERIKSGNIQDTTFINVEYTYADEVTVTYVFDEQVQLLTDSLETFSHGGSDLLVKRLQTIGVDIKAFIYLYDLNVKNSVDQKIRDGILAYVDKLDVGDSLFKSDIVRIIDATSGVRNVTVDLSLMTISNGEVSFAEIVDRSFFAVYEQGPVNSYFSPGTIEGPDGKDITLLKYTPQENGGTDDKEKSVLVDNIEYTLVDSPGKVSQEKGLAHISSNGSIYISFVDETKSDVVVEITYQVKKTDTSVSIEVSPFQLIEITNLEFVFLQK
jgi:hypothetical protein